jgi:beta-N-acetylhexosaminidase
MVMVGHLYLRDFATAAEQAQRKPIPASLSPSVVTGLLRQRMGYNGIVITDDLDMGAIRKQFGQRETVIRAVQAGVDILILSNSADPRVNLPSEVISWLSDAAARDPQIRRNIEQSYWRIKRLKERL